MRKNACTEYFDLRYVSSCLFLSSFMSFTFDFFAVWETMHALNIFTWGILVLGGFIIKMFTCEGFWLAEGYPGTQVIYSRTMIVFTCEHSDVLLVVGHCMCQLWHCCGIHLAGFGRCAKDDYLWMLMFSLFIVTLWSITCDHQR